MNKAYLVFIFGVLVKLVDDITDMKIFLRYKTISEVLLFLFTLYLLLLDEKLSPVASFVFGLGGLIAHVFAPHAVRATIWRAIIMVSVLPLLYHILTIPSFLRELTENDTRTIIYFMLPLLAIATVFSIVEDRLVPEEYGKRKLIDKGLQSAVLVVLLAAITPFAKKFGIGDQYKDVMVWLASAWLGYSITSVLTLLYYT